MKGKLMMISSISIAMILLMAFPVYADGPNEPHTSNAIWVEPSTIDLTSDGYTVGYKFNVTVYLNISDAEVFQYQIALKYNRTQLKAGRAGFTAPPSSEFMQGHASTALLTIDTSFLGNGSVLATEALAGTDVIDCTEPTWGSLLWIEFEVLTVSSATCSINLSGQTPADTWVWTPLAEDLIAAEDAHDATYVIPEFPETLILTIFMSLTIIVTIVFTKLRKFKANRIKTFN